VGHAARGVSAALTDDDIGLVNERSEELEAAGDSPDWCEIHEKFTGHLQHKRKRKLTSLIRNRRLQSEPYVRLAVYSDPQFRAASIRDHRELLRAVSIRDVNVDEKIIDRHLNATCNEVRRLLAFRVDMGGIAAMFHSPA
jgi:DNA-binding GntR family transcriptional regulator